MRMRVIERIHRDLLASFNPQGGQFIVAGYHYIVTGWDNDHALVRSVCVHCRAPARTGSGMCTRCGMT
jgi:hypothetical protein